MTMGCVHHLVFAHRWQYALILTTLLYTTTCASSSIFASTQDTVSVRWTLYPGLSLSWNDASWFCRVSGGHLPILHSRLAMHGMETVVNAWQQQGYQLSDFWIGLYSPKANTVPYLWEGNCSAQPADVYDWDNMEPDELGTELCVRAHLDGRRLAWRTKTCSSAFSVVCQTTLGTCTFNTILGAAVASSQMESSLTDTTDMGWCELQCLTARSNGMECVAAQFMTEHSQCRLLFGSTLLSSADVENDNDVNIALRECFTGEISGFPTSGLTNGDSSLVPGPACPCGGTSPVDDALYNYCGYDTTVTVVSSTTTQQGQDIGTSTKPSFTETTENTVSMVSLTKITETSTTKHLFEQDTGTSVKHSPEETTGTTVSMVSASQSTDNLPATSPSAELTSATETSVNEPSTGHVPWNSASDIMLNISTAEWSTNEISTAEWSTNEIPSVINDGSTTENVPGFTTEAEDISKEVTESQTDTRTDRATEEPWSNNLTLVTEIPPEVSTDRMTTATTETSDVTQTSSQLTTTAKNKRQSTSEVPEPTQQAKRDSSSPYLTVTTGESAEPTYQVSEYPEKTAGVNTMKQLTTDTTCQPSPDAEITEPVNPTTEETEPNQPTTEGTEPNQPTTEGTGPEMLSTDGGVHRTEGINVQSDKSTDRPEQSYNTNPPRLCPCQKVTCKRDPPPIDSFIPPLIPPKSTWKNRTRYQTIWSEATVVRVVITVTFLLGCIVPVTAQVVMDVSKMVSHFQSVPCPGNIC